MLIVKKEGIILRKTNLDFENEGVLNPAAIREGNIVHLFYRAVHKGNYSSIGYCQLAGALKVTERLTAPVLFPQLPYELHGVEDPRIVKIDALYYLTYTVFDGVTALGALATSPDLKNFEKWGVITPQLTYTEFNLLTAGKPEITTRYARFNQYNNVLWDKNLMFFPRKINGKFYFLHRIKPDILLAWAHNLHELTTEFWNNYFSHVNEYIVLSSKYEHERSYVGGGCPPIETEQGWLLIYHGVQETPAGYVYSACAALLDLENPLKEIARLPHHLFKPDQEWELKGEVNNVCFPTGAVIFDDTLYIYYGAADEQIACASLSLTALVDELLLNTTGNEKQVNFNP
jgi:beta-1,2-mannobiose phosphorylase / 1,2-beta-oligomannan phosphorylase